MAEDETGEDPYKAPKALDKFKVVSSGNGLTTEKLVQRIVERRLDYENRNAKKEKKEIAAYQAFIKQQQQNEQVDTGSN